MYWSLKYDRGYNKNDRHFIKGSPQIIWSDKEISPSRGTGQSLRSYLGFKNLNIDPVLSRKSTCDID